MTAIRKPTQSLLKAKCLRSGFSSFGGVSCPFRALPSTLAMSSLTGQSSNWALRQSPTVTHQQNFSTQVESHFQLDHAAVLSATLARQPQEQLVAHVMDLVEASATNQNYDKILLLMSHGDAAIRKNDTLGIPVLTGKGVGQALTLSHQTTSYCNPDTGLSPDLVILAPLTSSIQTTLHAFPYNTPDSVRGVSWICRGDVVNDGEAAATTASTTILTNTFPGMDMSYYTAHNNQSGNFLEWLMDRQERVIVVSSTTDWLQSFCESSLDCKSLPFASGEMRAIGLNLSNLY